MKYILNIFNKDLGIQNIFLIRLKSANFKLNLSSQLFITFYKIFFLQIIRIILEEIPKKKFINKYLQSDMKKTLKQNNKVPAINFRTLLKDRGSKQIVSSLSSSIVQSSFVDQSCSQIRMSNSVHSFKPYEQSKSTNNLKNFVRAMKQKTIGQGKIQSKVNLSTLKQALPKKRIDSAKSNASLRSTRSIISNRKNQYTTINTLKDDDNMSIKSNSSIKSKFNARNSLKNKIMTQHNSNINDEQSRIQKLNRMQRAVQSLMKTKLTSLMTQARSSHRHMLTKSFGLQNNLQFDQRSSEKILQKQISNILLSISLIKQREQANQTQNQIQEDIIEVAKKIQLVEKIIASSFTQAQILRKFYFAQKSQRYPHLNTKQNIKLSLSQRRQFMKTSSSVFQQNKLSKVPVLTYETTEKYFYKKPSKQSYSLEKLKYKSFIANRQPFQRSSYGCQFLNYGALPTFHNKPFDSKVQNPKMYIKTSIYQQTFRPKGIQLKQIDYKQLDCFKNKIKTGNISFAQLLKKNALKNQQNAIQKSKIQEKIKSKIKQKYNISNNKIQAETQKIVSKNIKPLIEIVDALKTRNSNTMISPVKFYGKSQMRSSYIHPNKKIEDETSLISTMKLKSVPLNRSLNKLKASYKAEYLR